MVGYLSLVQIIRYRRQQKSQSLFLQACCQDNSADATILESAEASRTIVSTIGLWEFPLIYRKSLEFALFRTYAIPSISRLLANTKVFATACGKRYDDTDLLLCELTENPFASERSTVALQRINAIHGMYKDKISNDDMLYVLSVFIFEPVRWIQRGEWRRLTTEECEALFLAWKHIGTGMGIRNIPATFHDYEAWNIAYEQKHMKYAASNAIIGNATMDLLLSLAPSFCHPLARNVVYCLMDSRLRAAMGFPDPPTPLQRVVDCVLQLRAGCLRYLCLPRLFSARRTPFAASSSSSLMLCPRFHIYERTYAKDGYQTDALGTAPKGKLLQNCPRFK